MTSSGRHVFAVCADAALMAASAIANVAAADRARTAEECHLIGPSAAAAASASWAGGRRWAYMIYAGAAIAAPCITPGRRERLLHCLGMSLWCVGSIATAPIHEVGIEPEPHVRATRCRR